MAHGQTPPARRATVLLVTPAGEPIGRLPPIEVATPWWHDAAPLVEAVRAALGIDIVVLRLLDTAGAFPGGEVTYLAQTTDAAAVLPWQADLDDHPLRASYARPGGPEADLRWAESALAALDIRTAGKARQVRTWNLSSLWQIPTSAGRVWLKAVPPFFAHEGAVIALLAGHDVPRLLAHDGGRILLPEIPGDDLHEPDIAQMRRMIDRLVALQAACLSRHDELDAMALPRWTADTMPGLVADALSRHASELAPDQRRVLESMVRDLPARFAALAACGIPDTLVHGDFHPGNVRGAGDHLTILDWGDSGIGHPLLDQPAFLKRLDAAAAAPLRDHWNACWRAVLPDSDPARAAGLLEPVAAARQAVIYRKFLDNIEPAERVYHQGDPGFWLRRTADILAGTAG